MSMAPIQSKHGFAMEARQLTTIEKQSSNYMVGQKINIQVRKKIDERSYLVLLGAQLSQVKSERPLPVGELITAVVTKNEDPITLRPCSDDAGITEISMDAAPSGADLDYQDANSLLSYFKCRLNTNEKNALQIAINSAPEAKSVAMAGALLAKKGFPISPTALQVLVDIQKGKSASNVPNTEQLASGKLESLMTIATLAQHMEAALERGAGAKLIRVATDEIEEKSIGSEPLDDRVKIDVGSDISVQDSERSISDSNLDENQKNHVVDLLSDIDPEGYGVRYGTLPILVEGHLIELELLVMRHRPEGQQIEPIRRLSMSINTSNLGRVRINAESLQNRLNILMITDVPDSCGLLAPYVDEVKQLAERFGWVVESVGYDIRSGAERLANQAIEHALWDGVINHVW